MHQEDITKNASWLAKMGLKGLSKVCWQLPPAALIETAIQEQEGLLTDQGALLCHTGKFTGRSPEDKFIVRDQETEHTVWWGPINHAFDPEQFDALYQKMTLFLQGKQVYIRDVYASALPTYQLALRVVNTQAWHNLFVHNLFLNPDPAAIHTFVPEFTIFHLPDYQATPELEGTKHSNFTIINFTKKLILIGGTGYAGEIKKSVFTVLNYLLPQKHQVLPMHCAATVGQEGDTAIYFGLSGTGKTTLSADPNRRLVGDDEHGWYKDGIFNFEGGCYAKTIDLDAHKEPQIFGAIKFGSVLENMCLVPGTRTVDYHNARVTENMRTAYPLAHIPHAIQPAIAGIPKHIFFLSCDAHGVLPPIAQLNREQAMYYFIAGYTAKIAGTEAGVGAPQSVFSACFGAPFLPLHPSQYAEMLGDKLAIHDATVWLINTGWVGGPYGVGSRIDLSYTRAMIAAVLSGALDPVSYIIHPVFDLAMPSSCPGVPSKFLDPSSMWADPVAYEAAAHKLMQAFQANLAPYAYLFTEQTVAAKSHTA